VKKLLWTNGILCGLILTVHYTFVITAFGGCVISGVTPGIASLCGVAVILLALPFLALVFVDFASVFVLWKQHGIRAFAPLAIILLAFFVLLVAGFFGLALGQWRFKNYMPHYEEVATGIEMGTLPMDEYGRVATKHTHLSYGQPIAYREEDGSLTVEFFVGAMGPPPKHIAYIYRSNGIIEKGSHTAERWHNRAKVNEHWFRVSD